MSHPPPSGDEGACPLLLNGEPEDGRDLHHPNTNKTMKKSSGSKQDLHTSFALPVKDGHEHAVYGSTCTEEDTNGTMKRRSASVASLRDDQDLSVAAATERDKLLLEREAQATCFQKYAKVLLVVPFIILNNMSPLIITPFIPSVTRAYFGGDKKAAEITSYIAAITAIIGMFTAPFYGKLLDTVGRRPFFIFVPIIQCLLPNLLFYFLPHNPLPYMVFSAFGMLFQGSFWSSYIADHYSSTARVKMYSIGQAAYVLAFLAGAFNQLFSEVACKVIAIFCPVLASLYGLFLIEESIPAHVKQPFAIKTFFDQNPISSMIFLLNSKVTKSLIAIAGCFCFAQVGTSDIFMYYAHARIGFNTADNGYLLLQEGIISPILMIVLVPLITKHFSPRALIFTSLVALLAELVLVAIIWAAWVLFGLVIPLACFTAMMIPMLYTLMANTGSVADQGRRLTGFAATIDLSNAIGPLFFGVVYGNVSTEYAFTPFAVAAVLVIPTAVIAWKLPGFLDEDKKHREDVTAEVKSSRRFSVYSSANPETEH